MPRARAQKQLAAFSVHLLTASGAACALLALFAAVGAAWVTMFAWLGLALFIDSIDGILARRIGVADALPRWSGDVLDFVVDFTTYVFVPAFAIAAGGLLPDVAALPLSAAIVISGALYFADRRMKTADNYFRGFPALWNAIALHLFVLKPPPWIAVFVVVVLILLTFMPLRFVHPFRVPRLRATTFAVLTLWSLFGLYALATDLNPGSLVAWIFTALGLYFFVAAALATRR